MGRLSKRIDDAGVLPLVRAYLNAGIMDGGVVVERHLGTPQGGPLSPLLANVLLDGVDKALEARGYCFARYADDCNVYVGSMKAGQRMMALLRKQYAGLKLQIDEAKSAGRAASLGASSWATCCGWPRVGRSNARWLPSRCRTSRHESGNSHAARAGAAWSKWCSGCGRTCWVGRRTSGWRKRQKSGANWTNGCVTA